VAPLQSYNHGTMARHKDGRGEVLLSNLAKLEEGDGHDSGSGLSTRLCPGEVQQ
jgi:hypothetical protein